MPLFGQIVQFVTLAFIIVTVGALTLAHLLDRKGRTVANQKAQTLAEQSRTASRLAYLLTLAVAAALTVACGILVFCFFTGDVSIDYVVHYRSDASWLFKLAGLWGGRQGSLLLWAWLIALFTAVIAWNHRDERSPLTSGAILVSELVLAAFLAVLVFSSSNNPFIATAPQYLNADGQLTGAATSWGMNLLLEHWAMAIHPPTLFIGYAGMTIPFAYAISALICKDASKRWVELSTRPLVISWLFLGAGIGLGAIWAYVVLGWGGYWGWDPVENASLLPWLLGVALIHSFTVYRRRNAFKRWSILCAALSFAFVILGTFITRSGIVDSVHAFEGDPVSLVLFLGLIIVSLLAGIVGIALRWKLFAGHDEIESLGSKEAAYYVNNLVMVLSALLLAYMTLSSALPDWLPYGGQKLAPISYDFIARPLGILYCLVLAVGPLLSWGKLDKGKLARKLVPGAIIALLLMALFVWLFLTAWLPNYTATLAAGGTNADELAAAGAPWYYHGLALLACLAASLIIGNTLALFARGIKARRKSADEGLLAALVGLVRHAPVQVGGYLSHLGIAICLVGLVGSSMYVLEKPATLAPNQGAHMQAGSYTLVVTGSEPHEYLNDDTELYLSIDVYTEGERWIGTVKPGIYTAATTMQTKQIAGVLGLPLRDIFVVFNVDDVGALVLDVHINPTISAVWIGFVVLMIGAALASLAKRRT
jgi:cytochrome c-type biogenesis protein CcmF